MNHTETLELLRALRDCGATRFKSNDMEIDLGRGSPPIARPDPAPAMAPPPVPEPPITEASPEAVEKLKGLINTLKMSDNQLVNAMFPVGPEG